MVEKGECASHVNIVHRLVGHGLQSCYVVVPLHTESTCFILHDALYGRTWLPIGSGGFPFKACISNALTSATSATRATRFNIYLYTHDIESLPFMRAE